MRWLLDQQSCNTLSRFNVKKLRSRDESYKACASCDAHFRQFLLVFPYFAEIGDVYHKTFEYNGHPVS
jgi:hypothetical protein